MFRPTLLLKTKPAEVVMQWGSGDLGRVAGCHMQARSGLSSRPTMMVMLTSDMEHIYQAGLPALTKQIASKNTHWFGQGKTSTAFKMVEARKEELNNAVSM